MIRVVDDWFGGKVDSIWKIIFFSQFLVPRNTRACAGLDCLMVEISSARIFCCCLLGSPSLHYTFFLHVRVRVQCERVCPRSKDLIFVIFLLLFIISYTSIQVEIMIRMYMLLFICDCNYYNVFSLTVIVKSVLFYYYILFFSFLFLFCESKCDFFYSLFYVT